MPYHLSDYRRDTIRADLPFLPANATDADLINAAMATYAPGSPNWQWLMSPHPSSTAYHQTAPFDPHAEPRS